jgi:hypothetical protein
MRWQRAGQHDSVVLTWPSAFRSAGRVDLSHLASPCATRRSRVTSEAYARHARTSSGCNPGCCASICSTVSPSARRRKPLLRPRNPSVRLAHARRARAEHQSRGPRHSASTRRQVPSVLWIWSMMRSRVSHSATIGFYASLPRLTGHIAASGSIELQQIGHRRWSFELRLAFDRHAGIFPGHDFRDELRFPDLLGLLLGRDRCRRAPRQCEVINGHAVPLDISPSRGRATSSNEATRRPGPSW